MTITIPEFSKIANPEERALQLERFLREFVFRLNAELEKKKDRRENNGAE
jgi:hypothetical protein